MFSRLVMTAILAVGLSASAQQVPYNRNNRLQQPMRQQPMLMPAEVQGTVQGVTRGAIVVLDANNQAIQVAVSQATKVQVTGTATAGYLHNGIVLEFKAEIDSHGAVKEPVSDLRIITSEKGTGLFGAESTADDTAGDVAKPAKRNAATKGAKAGAITPGAYRIVGRVSASHNGKLSVRAGRNTVTLELSDNPTINVESSDLLMAAQGDKVSAKGMKSATRAGMALSATEVKIEMAEPLVGAKKKGPAAKSDAKRSPKHPKNDDEPKPATEK